MYTRVASYTLALCLFICVKAIVASQAGGTCALPQDLQQQVAAEHSGAELVTLANLAEDDRALFQKDHGDACPGLTKVDFYGDGKPAPAFVLIENNEAKLIVAHRSAGRWQIAVLDTAGKVPAPIVWSQPAGHYADVYGRKEIRATKPVIVFTGYESWSILYARTGSRVAKMWLRD